MTSTRKILTGVAAAAGLAFATAMVYAAPPAGYGPGTGGCAWGGGPMGPGMMGYGPGMMGGGYGPGAAAGGGSAANFGERMDARLSFLKSELKITPDQETAWGAYAAQAKAQAATMQAFHAQPPAAAQTPAERIERHAERARLRAEQMKAMAAAVKDLYTALTPEQKAVADQHFGGPRLGQGGPRGYGRRWN